MLVTAELKRKQNLRQPDGTSKASLLSVATLIGDFQQLSARSLITRYGTMNVERYALSVQNSTAKPAPQDELILTEGSFTVENVEKRGISFKLILEKNKEVTPR